MSGTRGLSFGEALKYMEDGENVKRQDWGKEQLLSIKLLDSQQPYLALITTLWTPQVADLLAKDWQYIKKEK